jgi:hypothetical protein
MAEFLKSIDIEDRVEKIIANSKEFVYLITPYLYHVSPLILKVLAEADGRGVKSTIIYKKGLVMSVKPVEKLNELSGLTILSHEHLHAKAYFSESEAVVTSYNLLSNEGGSVTIDFGVYFSRAEQPDVYDQLLKDSRVVEGNSKNMKLVESKLVDEDTLKPKPEKKYREVKVSVKAPPIVPGVGGKSLTAKEKQALILQIFREECKDCELKIEDGDRMRVQGKSIVIFTPKEKVEIIFVRYATFQSKVEAVKQFFAEKHPGHGIWCSYNKITLSADKPEEVRMLFPSVKDAITSLALV